MFSRAFFVVALFAALLLTQTSAIADDGLNAAQKKEVEALVQDYILKNPEVLMRALQEYQIRKQIAEEKRKQENLTSLADDLQQNPASPVIGNPKGDITVVEFFDYRCGYCKRVFPSVVELLKEDGNIRYVLKEFPILGPDSLVATQASLAVWNTAPEKYMDFHVAMMTARGQLDRSKIFTIAGKLGLNLDALEIAMKTSKVTDEINNNGELAENLGITGTPAFIIGNQLAPGALSKEALKQMIEAARKG